MSGITDSLKSLGGKVTGLFERKSDDAGEAANDAYEGTKSGAADAQKAAGEKYDQAKDATSDAIVKGIKKTEDAVDSIK